MMSVENGGVEVNEAVENPSTTEHGGGGGDSVGTMSGAGTTTTTSAPAPAIVLESIEISSPWTVGVSWNYCMRMMWSLLRTFPCDQ